MPKLSEYDVKSLLDAEKSDALGAISASRLTEERSASAQLLPGRRFRRTFPPSTAARARYRPTFPIPSKA